jgi:hypothetical protein
VTKPPAERRRSKAHGTVRQPKPQARTVQGVLGYPTQFPRRHPALALIVRGDDRCGSGTQALIFVVFVDVVVKVRFRLLVRLSRRLSAGFQGPGGLLVGDGARLR